MSSDHDTGEVEQILRELDELRDPGGDPELEAVKAAILLEDSLGITLTDDEIDPSVLGPTSSVAEVVRRRTGGGS